MKEKLDSRPLACRNPTIASIFQSCKDAAKKSIRILRSLQDNKQICKYLYLTAYHCGANVYTKLALGSST